MSTRLYRLVTGNRGMVEAFTERPPTGTGWKVQCELDEDGRVPDNRADLFSPEGDMLMSGPLGPSFMAAVQAEIKHDMSKRHGEGPTDPQASQYGGTLPDAPTGPAQYRGTTGQKVAAQMLKAIVDPAGAWKLAVEHYPGMDTNHVQLLDVDGTTVIGSVAVLPIASLMARVSEAISGYRKGGQAAAPPEPPAAPPLAAPEQAASDVAAAAAPVETPPPGDEELARAARQMAEGTKAAAPPAGEGEVLLEIPIRDIRHFPGGNVRQQFAGLEDLAASIRELGIIQPLTVNEIGGRYTLVAGERRLRAADMAGLTTVPCRVKHWAEQQALEAMLVENIQREDLNPVEEARAYQRLLDALGSQGKVAERVGKSRVHVVEYLQLLELPFELQAQVASGAQPVKNGLEFLRKTKDVPGDARTKVARALEREQPSSREAPKLIDRILRECGIDRPAPPPPAQPTTQTAAASANEPTPPVARATPPQQEPPAVTPAPPQPAPSTQTAPSSTPAAQSSTNPPASAIPPSAPAQPPAPTPTQATPAPEASGKPTQDAVVALFIPRSLLTRFESLRGDRSDVEFLTALLDDWEAFNRTA